MKIRTIRVLACALTAFGFCLAAAAAMAGGELQPARIPAGDIPWPDSSARVDASLLKLLAAGSHYTEPAGMNHFAETRDEPVIAECTAIGPTGTTFVNPADDPRRNQ